MPKRPENYPQNRHMMISHPSHMGANGGAMPCCRAASSTEQSSARLTALHTGSKSWTQPAEPGICTQGLLGWDCPGTDKLRLNPFPGLSPSLLRLNGVFSVCVGTYRCPKTSIHRNTHGGYTQSTLRTGDGTQRQDARQTGQVQMDGCCSDSTSVSCTGFYSC